MSDKPRFTPEEEVLLRRCILDANPDLLPDATARHTMSRLLDRWAGCAAEVEAGYTLTLDDYLNDLTVRDILVQALPRVPSAFFDRIGPELNEIDARFRAATRPIARPIWPRPDGYWWWWRVPLILLPDLEHDLRLHGGIE